MLHDGSEKLNLVSYPVLVTVILDRHARRSYLAWHFSETERRSGCTARPDQSAQSFDRAPMAEVRYADLKPGYEQGGYSFVLGNHRIHRQRHHTSSCRRLPSVARSSTSHR